MTLLDSLDTIGSGMAYHDHLLGYRMESTGDLQTEKATLSAARTTFISQGMGSKTYQRDLRLLEERLQAVNYVLRERGATVIIPSTLNHGIGVANFENV